jgi:hypothetical protein
MSKKLIDVSTLFDAVADAGLDPEVLNTTIQMPRARNIVEWVQGEKFLSSQFFARQAEIAVRLFSDYCPACTRASYLDNVPVTDTMAEFLSNVVILEEGWCPNCKKNRIELYNAWWDAEGRSKYPEYAHQDYAMPWELVGCIGQRVGKSTMVGSFFSTYQVHRHLCLPNPAAYYETTIAAPFQFTFVATVVENALRNLWPNFHSIVRDGNWFKHYASEVRKEEKRLGLKAETLFKLRDTSVTFAAKQLHVSCAAAQETTLRGATRIGAAVDEIAYMSVDPNAKDMNADKTHTSLVRSLLTVRAAGQKRWLSGDPHPITGLMLNISSPAHKYDKIASLLKESKTSPLIFGFHAATWEINPRITRDVLHDEEVRDPVGFLRDYGAIAPLAGDTYISNIEAVKAMQSSMAPAFDIQTLYTQIADETLVSGTLVSSKDDRAIPRILALDAGHTNNAFGLGLYHLENQGGEYVFVTDGVFAAIPETRNGTKLRVSFPGMADLVLELHKHFRIVHTMYDRWQSIGEIQRLRIAGVKAESYSPTWADFETYKSMVLANKVQIPKWEVPVEELEVEDIHELRKYPYTHYGYQIATVQSQGKKVFKPAKGDDDMFRTAVLALAKLKGKYEEYAVTPGMVPQYGMQQQQTVSRAVGMLVTKSGNRRGLETGTSTGVGGVVGTVRSRTR